MSGSTRQRSQRFHLLMSRMPSDPIVCCYHLSIFRTIGLSAATLLLLSGDILGASGIVSSTLLSPIKAVSDPSMTWKLVFLSTFVLLSNTMLGAYFTDDERLGEDPSIPIVSVYGYLLGGAFVGFGTRLGNGCTTGHGICGMARLSKRSIVAVCVFMASAFSTAALTAPDNKATSKGTEFLRADKVPELFNRWLGFGISMFIVLPTILACYNLFSKTYQKAPGNNSEKTFSAKMRVTARTMAESVTCGTDHGFVLPETPEKSGTEGVEDMENPSEEEHREGGFPSSSEDQDTVTVDNTCKLFPSFAAGAIFAVGLGVSEMVLPSKVLGFLNFFLFAQGSYDPTLLTVMIGGCVVSWVSYQFVKPFGFLSEKNPYARECPVLAEQFSVPTNTVIDTQLVGGAVCFGIGWGIAGLCPGPAIFLAASGAQPVICYWWPAFLVGSFAAQEIKRHLSRN